MIHKSSLQKKGMLHSRNRHQGRYDFEVLIKSSPELEEFLVKNEFGDVTIRFADAAAVKALNRALLKHFYGILSWDIPAGYLCPPIPGRADLLHYLADLLSFSNQGVIPRGPQIRVLDIGVGANCIYPLIGQKEYGWSFLGSETDPQALQNAEKIIKENPQLGDRIQVRLQASSFYIFSGLLGPKEKFDLSICNPPFHASLEEAQEGSHRKWDQLKKNSARKGIYKSRDSKGALRNFGGQGSELWYEGGEIAFVGRMVAESADIRDQCFWFSTLVSKESNLPLIKKALEKAKAFDVQAQHMSQGQKRSRIVAWTFLTEREQAQWRFDRWKPK